MLPPVVHLRRVLFAALLSLGGASCSAAALGRGIDDYQKARYPEALGALQELEQRQHCLTRAERARWFLYRGLIELALGDAWQAHRYLSSVKRLLERDPTLLDRADRGRLSSAWRSLGKMPGELQ